MMEGLERITARLEAEGRAEEDAILAQANREAQATREDYRRQAETLQSQLRTQAEAQAAALEERLIHEAELEGRKALLEAKWEGVEGAYALARQLLADTMDPAALETALRLDRRRNAGQVAAILYGEDTP